VSKVWRFPAPVACVGGAQHMLAVACADGSIWTWTATAPGGEEARSKRQRLDEEDARLPAVVDVVNEAVLVCALSANALHVPLVVCPAGPDSHDCL
jgi:hypothetical protein